MYHRREGQTGKGPCHGQRQICLERLEHDAEGFVRPIVMTGGDGPR